MLGDKNGRLYYQFESERLLCRILSEQDRTLYVELYSNEKIMRNIGPPLTEQEANKAFDNTLNAIGNSIKNRSSAYLLWVIILKTTGQKLGIQVINGRRAALLKHSQDKVEEMTTPKDAVETGIMLTRLAHGKQVPFEARGALIKFAFSKLPVNQIYTFYKKRNIPIDRLVNKLGFVENKCLSPLSEKEHYRFITRDIFTQRLL